MVAELKNYTKRCITFQQLYKVNNRIIKIYTIALPRCVVDDQMITDCKKELPKWLDQLPVDLDFFNYGYLVIHKGEDANWVLLSNWAVGNMVHTQLFTYYDGQFFSKPYGTDALMCIWEMEVQWHERKTWISHVLSDINTPDFTSYLNQNLSNNKNIIS